MINRIYRSLLLCLLLVTISACSAESKGRHLTFNIPADDQLIVALHNQGSESITVDHVEPDPGASAGWASELSPNHWSLLMIANNRRRQHPFIMECYRFDKHHNLKHLNCSHYINYQYLHLKLPDKLSNGGSFWLTENKAPGKLVASLKQRGVKLSDSERQHLNLTS